MFMGAFTIISIQLILIYLIYDHLFIENEYVIPTTSFKIIFPRFISSLMMHVQVEPDIRAGLGLMKYVVNHPHKFRLPALKESDDHGYDSGRICGAFILGFCQFSVAIIIEFLVIVFLLTQKTLTDVIMKFVALAAITKFDDFYAASLYDEKMFKAVGKTIPTEFRRTMSYYKTDEERDKKNQEVRQEIAKKLTVSEEVNKIGVSASVREGFIFKDPKVGHWYLYVLRFI